MVYGCLIEVQDVSAWLKETAQTCVFMLSCFFLLKRHEPQSSSAKLAVPLIQIGIVVYAFRDLVEQPSSYKHIWLEGSILLFVIMEHLLSLLKNFRAVFILRPAPRLLTFSVCLYYYTSLYM